MGVALFKIIIFVKFTQGRLTARRSDTIPQRPWTAGGQALRLPTVAVFDSLCPCGYEQRKCPCLYERWKGICFCWTEAGGRRTKNEPISEEEKKKSGTEENG